MMIANKVRRMTTPPKELGRVTRPNNKDVEGGTICDRLEEHSRRGGALRRGAARGGSLGHFCSDSTIDQFKAPKSAARIPNKHSQNLKLGAGNDDMPFADLHSQSFGNQDETRVAAQLRR